MLRSLVSLLPVGLALAGCANNTTDGMDLPVVAAPPPAATSASFFQSSSDNQASFRLERVLVDLPRGTVIAHFPNRFWKKWEYLHLCNLDYGEDATIEWSAGTGYFGNWTTEAGGIFYDVMRRRGANVVGDSSALFNRDARVQSAEFLVGGRITDIRGNICHRHEPVTSKSTRQYLGEFYVKVEWEVFSTLTRQVVHKFETEGFAKTSKPMRNGITVTLYDAFAAAVEYAATDSGFLKALSHDRDLRVPGASHERLAVKGRKGFRKPLKDHLPEVAEAAVTIELGASHGSGFLISHDGYLLTNAHVVGDGKRVPVVFRNGVRVNGIVLRSNRHRDVALVRVPIVAAYILPVRQDKRPAVADEVYVVGSPFDPGLRSTVTKGIVSAFRKFDGVAFIQSDAAVTGGNSGGPLLDDRGNVVGITVAKFTQGENLNLFIPIDEALKALNIEIAVE